MAFRVLGGGIGGVAVIILGVLVVVIGFIIVLRIHRARRLAQEKMEQAIPGNPITPRPYFAPYQYHPPSTVIDMTNTNHVQHPQLAATTSATEQTVAPPSYPGHVDSVTKRDGSTPSSTLVPAAAAAPSSYEHKTPNKKHPTVEDEEKEVYHEYLPTEADLNDDDEEYPLDPEAKEAIDKRLEDEEHEDHIAEIAKGVITERLRRAQERKVAKSGEREVQVGGGRREGTGTGGDVASIVSAESSKGSTKSGNHNEEDDSTERNVEFGGGRRKGAGTGRDVASTASAESSKGSTKNRNHHDGESTHDKRCHADYTGASSKVGYIDYQTAMTRAKYRFQGPEESDPFDESPPPAPAPDTFTLSQLEKDDDGKAGLELSAPALVNKEWRTRIYHHPVWQEICEKADLSLPACRQEAHGYERPNYFQLAHENAKMICEQCYKMTRPSGSFRALPVAITDAAVPAAI
ncbi:hypothetical protein BGX33_003365 [Mortierella sp. NVP41]|nr:hypothetical protein BGX33_003365 [Mortierella sp. NVP41]